MSVFPQNTGVRIYLGVRYYIWYQHFQVPHFQAEWLQRGQAILSLIDQVSQELAAMKERDIMHLLGWVAGWRGVVIGYRSRVCKPDG